MGERLEFQPGWSIARLAEEFGLDRRTATKRLREAGVPPMGKRSGHDVYRLRDAAPALVDLVMPAGEGGVVDPRDLPPMERRAYFQSENERLKVETTVGKLVPAAEVEADMAHLVKQVTQTLETLPDVLERDCALSPEQVVQVQESCDELRQAMWEAVTGTDPEDDVRDRA